MIRISCDLRDELMAQIVECKGEVRRPEAVVTHWETENGLHITDASYDHHRGHRDCEHYAGPVE